MAKINRPNNIVTLGQSAPVGIGQSNVENSLPVVIATDQPAIPVEEQNKIQSEVALSLLGIPRSEVALGIFADVNTYDVDPSEWTQLPAEKKEFNISTNPYQFGEVGSDTAISGDIKFGHGLSHMPEEAGALLEAPPNKTAVLTSKRFFRYQPGRVSAATFGVKSSVINKNVSEDVRNPSIRKYGIYDNFDGYYWETIDTGLGDQFRVVRRTQALIKYRSNFGSSPDGTQIEDYGVAGRDNTATSSVEIVGSANTQGVTSLDVSLAIGAGVPKEGMRIYDAESDKFNIAPDTRIETVAYDEGTQRYTLTLSHAILGNYADGDSLKLDFSGDLVILRDSLVLTHAAIYDPTLLKEETEYKFNSVDTNEITLDDATGLEVGQMVMYESKEVATEDVDAGEAYSFGSSKSIFIIKSINNNTVTLADVEDNGTGVTFSDDAELTAANHVLKTPVPFIFPKGHNDNTADICWPYKRNTKLDKNTIQSAVGAIETDYTAFDTNFSIKDDIDDVNTGDKCISIDTLPSTYDAEGGEPVLKRAWSNWIRHNVKPEFYGVYEYRIPRSRFSFDFVDGTTNKGTSNQLRYSDFTRVAGGDDGETSKYPGQPVEGDNNTVDSVFKVDFERVMMNKIEFSWYGAVGALFLVYVPVGNGEARWVRVHHIRASNQLKVASLGNATLPLTYTIYGGGTGKTLGRHINDSTIPYIGGRSASEFVTKYGSSYYIDGGDRGTVKLFNYANDELQDLETNVYQTENFTIDGSDRSLININYDDIHLKGDTSPYEGIGNIDDALMKARVVTDNSDDINVSVKFVKRVSDTSIQVVLNKELQPGNPAQIEFIADTGQSLYGLTSKTNIESSQGYNVRNRVQVYPTKLSVALTSANAQADAVRLELNKNVVFQTNKVFDIIADSPYNDIVIGNSGLDLEVSGLPTKLTTSNTTELFADDLFAAGDKLYGWFLVENAIDDSNQRPLFGFVERIGTEEFNFVSLDTYTEELKFVTGEKFLYAKSYRANGSEVTVALDDDTEEIERLSSIEIIKKTQRPIPSTGTKISTFFLERGSEYFDLSPYFDYNKDYISFPLTNVPDNLYLTVKTEDVSWNGKASASITWEEQ
jgi:hypothetical protein